MDTKIKHSCHAHRNAPAKNRLSVAIGLVLVTSAAPYLAQAAVLEEVIVTAQKRAENVQDVPLSVTAISADALSKAGITNTTDLVKLSPSLTFSEGQNKQGSSFSIRGIGTNVYSIGVETSVAVVIDDVSTVQAGQSLANLVDVERIEVLRGPQSTLFGKSASAGLINVTTKAPSEEFEASVEMSATDDDENRISASLSGPITDDLGYRLTGYYSDLDDYVDNLTYGDGLNESERKGVRGKLRWDITDAVQADFTAYFDKDDSTCCALTWAELDPDARVFGFVPGEVAEGIKPSDENRKVRTDDRPESETEKTGGNVRFVADFGDFTVTSITAYDNWQYSNTQDVDLSDVDIVGFFTGGALHGGFVSTSDIETDFYSQEFRLASPSYDNYDYQLGFYYANAQTDRTFLRNPGLPILPSDWDATAETESMALYGQLNWHFTEATHLVAGVRWNDEEVSIDYVNNLDPAGGRANGSDSDTAALGNLSLQHYLSEDVMLYARYAMGYKGQAYNVVSGFTQEDADSPVAPETSDAFELGFKSTLWEQRLQLNATAFYTEYDDFQAQNTIVTPDGQFLNKLRNVGKVTTRGVELEGIALLGENLTFTFGASYADTEIKSFDGAPCYPGQTEATGCSGGSQDLEGARLPNAPEWKYNLAGDYNLELSNMPFYGFINVSYVWQDEINFALTQNPLTVQDSYGIASASIGISERASDLYRVTLFVNNFTDESYRAGMADARELFGGKTAVVQNLPRASQRYAGVRVKFNF